MVTAVKDGSDGVASVIRGFGAGNEGKSAVKTLGKKHLFGVNCICKCLPYRFSNDFVCLQTSPFEKVIINAVTRKKIFFQIKSANMHS